ncbi:uncharacterized protein LOC112557470 [Pomacea canaliculata]|uniref:uncharacterized protein LOC112557470 n=1 Tax=Pomacea canaliculata TaxID=400727 RepID=UPI000D73596E|nr:uncharacterized protein LOC112557470 [Pomacea canaliculata]
MLSSCCWCLILVAMVAGAPVQEEKVRDAKTAEVQNQEKELKSLLHLADEQEKHKDVSVHEEHVQHLHDVNGLVTKEEETRKTVTDVKTGKLLSDVKQEVKSEEVAAAGASPKVEVKTEVDVPAEGVHETLVQLEDGAGVADKEDEAEEFSPEVVAEYLYQTGDFDRFYTTLAQLVNNSVMTEAEAVNFAELVAQYYRQRVEEYENNILVQRRAQSQPLPDLYPMTLDAREPYPLGLENDDRYLLSLDNSDSYGVAPQDLPTDTEVDANAYDILGELLREAFVGGDERAQAIVQELYNQAENRRRRRLRAALHAG